MCLPLGLNDVAHIVLAENLSLRRPSAWATTPQAAHCISSLGKIGSTGFRLESSIVAGRRYPLDLPNSQ
jgi:hypothetical protein